MRMVRTTTVALLSGFLMSGAFAPAWSGPPVHDGLTVAQATSPNPVVQAASSMLAAPEFARNRIRPDTTNNCKPGQMYSAHDIVGDPQTCIMGSTGSIGDAQPTVTGAPGL
jgi:hypothetical protein